MISFKNLLCNSKGKRSRAGFKSSHYCVFTCNIHR